MRKRFFKVMLINALYCFVSNFIHPVTPTMITRLGLPDRMFGMLFAAMALGNFLFSPVWGRIADRHGRRIVLILSLLGYAAGQAVFGFCGNASVMLAARFFGGCMTGGTSVALLALVVDICDESNRTRQLSLFAAVQSVCYAMGYFTGGMLGMISIPFVFIAHISILLLSAVLAFLLLPDIPAVGSGETVSVQKRSLADMEQMLSLPMALFFLGVVFANISTYGFDNAFNYFLCREFGFPSSVNGSIKAVTGILGLLANLFLNRWIASRFDNGKSLPAVLSLCALALLAASLQTGVVPFIGMNVLFYVLNATYVPIQQSLMAGQSASDYGLLSGIFNASRSLGMVAGSLSAGLLYEINARLPFFAQGACFLLAALVSILSQRLMRKGQGEK